MHQLGREEVSSAEEANGQRSRRCCHMAWKDSRVVQSPGSETTLGRERIQDVG